MQDWIGIPWIRAVCVKVGLHDGVEFPEGGCAWKGAGKQLLRAVQLFRCVHGYGIQAQGDKPGLFASSLWRAWERSQIFGGNEILKKGTGYFF